MRDFAIKAGLTITEADEVVQETAIAMARHLPEYRYNPKVCRFKTWLLNQTSWRIKDQFKKRKRKRRRIIRQVRATTRQQPSTACRIRRRQIWTRCLNRNGVRIYLTWQ